MKIAKVQLSNGKIAKFEVPDEATQEDVMAAAKQYDVPESTQSEPAVKQRSLLDYAVDQSGNLARGTMMGIASIPDTPIIAQNLINQGIDFVTGRQSTPDPLLTSPLMKKYLDAVGVPNTPDSMMQKIGAGIGGGATAGMTGAVAGASGGLSAGVAENIGLGPVGQTLAGIGGGIIGGNMFSRATKPPLEAAPLMRDIEKRGLEESRSIGVLGSRLKKKAENEYSRNNQQFEVAKVSGRDAFVDEKDVKALENSFRKSASLETSAQSRADLLTTANNIRDKVNSGIVTVNDLQEIRRSAQKNKSYIGRDIRTSIDDTLATAGIIKGDPKSVELWDAALKGRKAWGDKYERPVEIASALEKGKTVEEVEAALLGSSLNISSAKGIAGTYDDVLKTATSDKMKDTYGFMMRQSIVNKMVKTAARNKDSEKIGGKLMANQIKNLRVDNSSLWNKFTVSEKGMLRKLEKDLRKAAEGGWIARTATTIGSFLNRKVGANIQAPQYLRPSGDVSIDALLEMTRNRPKDMNVKAGAIMGSLTQNQAGN